MLLAVSLVLLTGLVLGRTRDTTHRSRVTLLTRSYPFAGLPYFFTFPRLFVFFPFCLLPLVCSSLPTSRSRLLWATFPSFRSPLQHTYCDPFPRFLAVYCASSLSRFIHSYLSYLSASPPLKGSYDKTNFHCSPRRSIVVFVYQPLPYLSAHWLAA